MSSSWIFSCLLFCTHILQPTLIAFIHCCNFLLPFLNENIFPHAHTSLSINAAATFHRRKIEFNEILSLCGLMPANNFIFQRENHSWKDVKLGELLHGFDILSVSLVLFLPSSFKAFDFCMIMHWQDDDVIKERHFLLRIYVDRERDLCVSRVAFELLPFITRNDKVNWTIIQRQHQLDLLNLY